MYISIVNMVITAPSAPVNLEHTMCLKHTHRKYETHIYPTAVLEAEYPLEVWFACVCDHLDG